MEVWVNLPNLGLILTIVGSLLTAFSVGKPRFGNITWTGSLNGKRATSSVVAMNYPLRYRVGLILIALGSFLQIAPR